MPTPPRPESKIGNVVEFSPPISVGEAAKRRGKIKDELWSEIYPDSEWGYYIYTSQLIEWENGGRSIRITYYYRPEGAKHWFFGGQYSIDDEPKIIRKVLEATLNKNWYAV